MTKTSDRIRDVIVIGGGPAGFYATVQLLEKHPVDLLILEGQKKVLSKVLISGGGRCNVTNEITEPKRLASHYPRGEGFLSRAFELYSSNHTRDWFESKGVALKVEADGRVFPTTNKSETIAHCLEKEAVRLGAEIRLSHRVKRIAPKEGYWEVEAGEGRTYAARFLILGSGSNGLVWKEMEDLGVRVVEPVASLFTFNSTTPLTGLAGVSVADAGGRIKGVEVQHGPVLFTHRGISGPLVLKLSAWGARELHQKDYRFTVFLNFLGSRAGLVRTKATEKMRAGDKGKVKEECRTWAPKRLVNLLWEEAELNDHTNWAEIGKKKLNKLLDLFTKFPVQVQGKSTFKEEFVTAGGIDLEEVDFPGMFLKKYPTIYAAGEVLNIDGITGGFNFQGSWTTGALVGENLAARLKNDT
jgi:hypothetical protein